MRKQLLPAAGIGLAALLPAAPAAAANVTFAGVVANLCVLTVSTPGALGVASNGTMLSSEELGGVASILAVAATGTNPTISFSAPQLSGPGGALGSATKEIGYSSTGGANQGWTTGATSYTANRLIDTVTIRGRATNADGFATGAYSLSSTVTCQQ